MYALRILQLATTILIQSFVVQEIEAVKQIGAVCEPSKNECGQNAVCYVPFKCGKGRCACESNEYRPVPKVGADSDVPVAFNCTRLLRIGDACASDETRLLNLESGLVCVNSTVTCRPNFTPVGNSACVTKSNIREFGEQCNDTMMCNPLVGLTCNFSPRNASLKTCQCRPGMRIAINKDKYAFGQMCTLPETGDLCDDTSQCVGQYNNVQDKSICSKNTGLCECNTGYSAAPYPSNNNDMISPKFAKPAVVKSYCVVAKGTKVKKDDTCTVLGPMLQTSVTPILCEDKLVCYSCPEFDELASESNPRPGKCFTITDVVAPPSSQLSGRPRQHIPANSASSWLLLSRQWLIF